MSNEKIGPSWFDGWRYRCLSRPVSRGSEGPGPLLTEGCIERNGVRRAGWIRASGGRRRRVHRAGWGEGVVFGDCREGRVGRGDRPGFGCRGSGFTGEVQAGVVGGDGGEELGGVVALRARPPRPPPIDQGAAQSQVSAARSPSVTNLRSPKVGGDAGRG